MFVRIYEEFSYINLCIGVCTHIPCSLPSPNERQKRITFDQEIPTGHEGNKYSTHLERYAVFSAERFPTFRKIAVPSLLGLNSPRRIDVFK